MNVIVNSNHSLGTYQNCEVYKPETPAGASSFTNNTVNDTINYKYSAIIKRSRIFGCEYRSIPYGNSFSVFTLDMIMVDKHIDDKQSHINMSHAKYLFGPGVHFLHDKGSVFINKEAISAVIINDNATETDVVFNGSFVMRCVCKSIIHANDFRFKLLN